MSCKEKERRRRKSAFSAGGRREIFYTFLRGRWHNEIYCLRVTGKKKKVVRENGSIQNKIIEIFV